MVAIRKIAAQQEEIQLENGVKPAETIKRLAVAAVVKNPFAGEYRENLQDLIDAGDVLGVKLAAMAADILGRDAIESFGKAAIVGEAGEYEHGAAMNHVKFGNGMREGLGFPCKTIIPSTIMRGGPGAIITVPLVHREANLVRSHFDAMEVRVPDAPHRDEIVVIAVFAQGGRPLQRLGGLKKDEIVGDGIK